MSIIQELETKKSKTKALIEWIEGRPKAEREEWLQAMREIGRYSNAAIAQLLVKKGFDAYPLRSLENVVYRFRQGLK
jgi:predicted translin family RNA/ssDNA-binding protein